MGILDSERTALFQVTDISVVIKNVVRKFQCIADLGSMDII